MNPISLSDSPALAAPVSPPTPAGQPNSVHALPFGSYLESIAAWAGLPPADVALCVAGVLGGIAGPYAGLVEPTRGRIRPSLNLVCVGGPTARIQRLEERLFHPLRTRAAWLRQRASSHSQSLLNECVFGRHDSARAKAPLREHYLWLNDAKVSSPENQKNLMEDLRFSSAEFDEQDLTSSSLFFNDRKFQIRSSAGAAHLPSLFFENLPADHVTGALNESIHREALLLNPLYNESKRHAAARRQHAELVSLLRGLDLPHKRLHPDQGPGSFEHSRVHLWTSTTMDRLSEALVQATEWSEVYKHSILWETHDWKAPKRQPHDPVMAWEFYDAIVHDLLERRCFGGNQHHKRLAVPRHYQQKYEVTQQLYVDHCDRIDPENNPFTVQFHDLPARLLWVLLQFHTEDETFWCGKAAFQTALHALRRQDRLLTQARTAFKARRLQQTMMKVTMVLRQKGPCKLRDIQRSSNNLKAAQFRPAIEMLQNEGRVQIDANECVQLVQRA